MSLQAAIIGGGPGGYVTAIRLQQKGISTLLFEKERLGGECLNWGCIPTKALVKISDLFNEFKHAEKFGIEVSKPGYDYQKIAARKDEVVEKLVGGLEFICKKKDITIVKEEVLKVKKKGEKYLLETSEDTYETEYVVIATGSVPFELPGMEFDGENFLSSRHILSLRELPEHLTIIGGGTIGCEFASIFSNLGIITEIVELLPNLLNNEDREIVRKLQLAFKKKGIKIHPGTKVTEHSREGEKIKLQLSNDKEILTDKVLVSTGRVPYCPLEFVDCPVEQEKKRIVINDRMETSQKNIFAIGDVTGRLMLAHTASKQGLQVAEYIAERIGTDNFKKPDKLIYQNIPRCTFTDPELSSVGMTEEEAKEEGREYLTGKFTYQANGKAIGLGATEGMIKIIADKESGKITGMHIVGAQATELITAGSLMINLGLTVKELDKVVYAHPTLSEIIMEAVEDLENLAIHKV
jgi:dihydrolipoamide dehydrogenase